MSRRGSAFTSAVGLVLLAALAAYAATGLWGSVSNRVRFACAERRSVTLSLAAEGIIIREELPIARCPVQGLRLGAGDSLGGGFSAPAAGLCFPSDGWEHLSPADIENIDAGGIAALMASPSRDGAGGRLICGKDWYFAALLPESIALQVGQRLSADFGIGEVPCLVQAVGEGFAVLRMDTQLSAHALLRQTEAEIITDTLSGLAIPENALHTESGGSFVWAITAGRLEKKTVNIIFSGDGFLLAEESNDASGLRAGDKLVTAGKELYEGKILT